MCYYDDFYILFLPLTQKLINSIRKILISDLESALKNTSIERKYFILRYVQKVKFYKMASATSFYFKIRGGSQ